MTHDDRVLHIPSGEYPVWMGRSIADTCWVWFDDESEPTLVDVAEVEPAAANGARR